MTTGIYSITNKVNGKRYIGSAVVLSRRFAQHKNELKYGRHHSVKLQRSWDKHGPDAFVFEVLEVVSLVSDDLCELIALEQKWIDTYKSSGVAGYNVLHIAGSSIGYRHTEETKATFRHELSAEHRANIGAAGKGRITSEETKAKLSAAMCGVKKSNTTRAKMKQAMAGRKCKPRTPEHIANHASALRATLAAKRAGKLEANQA